MTVTFALGALIVGCSSAPETGTSETHVAAPTDVSPVLAKLRAERAEKERLDEEAGLTYTIEVSKDHIVRFVMPEGEDPNLGVVERMPAGEKSAIDPLRSLTVAEIVETLRPGTQVPERLQKFLDARPVERDDGATADTEDVPLADPAPVATKPDLAGSIDLVDPVVTPRHVSTADHFRSAHCPVSMNNGGAIVPGDVKACDLSMLTDNRSASATHSGVVVGTFRGSTTVSGFISGKLIFAFSTLAGEMGSGWLMSGITQNCTLFFCGDPFVATKTHQYTSTSQSTNGGHDIGMVWVRRSGATRGHMTPIF